MNRKAAKRLRYVACTAVFRDKEGSPITARKAYLKLKMEYKNNPYHLRDSLNRFGIKPRTHKEAIEFRKTTWRSSMRRHRRKLKDLQNT